MTGPRLELRQRVDDLWDWHLIAGNGEELCGTQQGYRDEHDAHRGFDDTLGALAELVMPTIIASDGERLHFDLHRVRLEVVAITKDGEDLDALDAEAGADRDAKHAAKHAERAARTES